jgi:hypothetical protein
MTSSSVSVPQKRKQLEDTLPNPFNGEVYFLFMEDEEEAKRELERRIVAYGGQISPSLQAGVTHVIHSGDDSDVNLIFLRCDDVMISEFQH